MYLAHCLVLILLHLSVLFSIVVVDVVVVSGCGMQSGALPGMLLLSSSSDWPHYVERALFEQLLQPTITFTG